MAPVGWVGWGFVVLYVVLLPLAAWHTAQLFDQPEALPPKRQMLRAVAAQLAVLGAIAAAAGWWERVPLWPARWPSVADWGWALLVFALAAASMVMRWRRSSARARARWSLMLPEDRPQFRWWIVVALLAGISEELAYRGVLTTVLSRASGQWIVAAALSLLAFALAHWWQGGVNVLLVALFGLALQLLALGSGSLLTAIVLHAVYDLWAGWWLMNRARAAPRFSAACSAESDTRPGT
jgi:membrane protease YdiL (CAAX protease family)